MNENVRVLFEKKGRAAYISHLDLMHTLQRVFVRAGIRIKHTEGFNPHPYMSIAIPLSVCCESECEIMDFVVDDNTPLNEIADKLNAVMPEGIRVLKAYKSDAKVREIKWIEHEITFEYDNYDVKDAAEILDSLFKREEIFVTKKTKHGTAEINLAENIKNITFTAEGKTVKMKCLLSAQEPSINPVLIITAVDTYCTEMLPDYYLFCRKKLFNSDMTIFK